MLILNAGGLQIRPSGDFIYGHQFNVMKRLGYDYVDR